MGTLGGFAAPFGPPPTTSSPLASLGLAKPSRDAALPAEPAGSAREGLSLLPFARLRLAPRHGRGEAIGKFTRGERASGVEFKIRNLALT